MTSRQLKTGALLSYAGVAFTALAGLLYTPWMISCIGAGNYGLYTLALSVINLFLMDFGLGEAVSRFLSKFRAEDDEQAAADFLGITYRFYFVLDAIILAVLIALFFFLDVIFARLEPTELETFKILYCIVSCYSIISFPFLSFNGILTANEQFISLNGCNLLQKIIAVGLIIIALVAGYGVFELVTINAVTGLFFLFVKFLIIKRTTSTRPCFHAWNKNLAREVVDFSGWTTVIYISARFVFVIMPSILAAVSSTWEVALFGLASSLEGYVFTVANALGGMFMPKVSRILAHERNPEVLQSLIEQVGRIEVSIIGLLFVGFVGSGKLFVTCWMGSEYLLLYPCAILLILPSLVELPQTVANTAITAMAALKHKAIVYALMATTNVILGVVLSMRFGAIGACASICLAYFVRTAGMNVLYVRKLNFKIGHFFKDNYMRWIGPAAVTLACAFGFSLLENPQGWFGFIQLATLIVCVYTLLLYLLYLQPEDRALIADVSTRFKRK